MKITTPDSFKSPSKLVLFALILLPCSILVNIVGSRPAGAYFNTPDSSCPTKNARNFSGQAPSAGGNVPTSTYNYLNVSDCYGQSPAVSTWVVVAGTQSSSASVTSTTPSIGLVFGGATTVGFSPSSTTITQWNINSVTSGANLSGSMSANLGSGSNTPGATAIATKSFTYAPPGGSFTAGQLRIDITVRVAAQVAGVYRCVQNGASTSSLSGTNCPLDTVSAYINVTIINNPPSGSITASCYAQNNVTYVSVSYRLTDADNNRLSGSISGSGSGNPVPYATFNTYPGTYTLSGSPFVFNGTFRNTYSISGSVSDGIANRSFSGSFNCPGPPIISCTITGNTIEVGTNLTPSMTISNSNPSSSSLTATVSFSASSDVNGFFANLTGASPPSPTTVSYSGSRAITFASLTPSSPGRINLRGSFSWTTPGNAYSGSGNCTNATADVVRKPFFVNKGGDMLVGGAYPSSTGTCPGSTPTGNLSSWANATSLTSRSGANAELMARVYGIAFEFYSASTVASTNAPTGKFRNWLTAANNSDSTRPWGGGSGEVGCLKDFYKETKKTTLPISSISSASVESLDATADTNEQIEINGNLVITGASNFAGKVAVYVNGNVHIQNSITLNENYSSNPANIPFFSLIVRGNIYIGPGVDRLDGVYVAQPNPTANGIIYTCANSLTLYVPYFSDQIYSNCNRQLIFNGMVQARDIKLLRVWGTLRENIPAEVFNYMPELYIANSAFVNDSSGLPPYDSAASLPPAL